MNCVCFAIMVATFCGAERRNASLAIQSSSFVQIIIRDFCCCCCCCCCCCSCYPPPRTGYIVIVDYYA